MDDATTNNKNSQTLDAKARRLGQAGRLITALLACAVGYVVASFALETGTNTTSVPAKRVRPPTLTPDGVDRAADAALSPLEVVEEQMKALTACKDNRGGAARVFSLASPANKAVTGPVDRFEKMLWSPPFDALILNKGWSTGRVVERDGAAAVLVLTVQPDGETIAFRFYLSRQEGEESDRWMTDAVLPLQKAASEERFVSRLVGTARYR